ncbi:MAG TPA: GLUG motif-containing protein [Sedimentisphaerales bacterium]|nr:GLUG motif-containing protein [Sedimentisphaerales bacterium]HRS10004.1 GLUG motif-containing protein [Sedimentisphaerales bacterium]HRV46710.1 GLUG motif-containing protein [Sedimentisphaerales bacterium]
MEARKRQNLTWAFILCAMLLLAVPICANAAGIRADRYVFSPERSTIVQTGGFAGVHWTYSVEGQFCLTVDPNAGSARFEQVDADAVDVSQPMRTLDPNAVFNLTGLAGKVVDDAIEFTGQTADGSSVHLTLTFEDDAAYLTGGTTPPPNSADFFLFAIDAVATRKYAGGTGDPNTPYLIATAEQMNAIGTCPEDWDKHFQLTADIDLSPFDGKEGRPAFNIIAPDYEHFFKGSFDGKGHTIANFTHESRDGCFAGLFGRVLNGTIRNLHLVDPNVQAQPSSDVGVLVGRNTNGTMSACSVQGGNVTGGVTVGGLVGYSSGRIVNCSTSCRVDGNSAGGLAGCNGGGNISMCYSTGEVFGNEAVGGLVGWNGRRSSGVETWYYSGQIDHSYSTGAVRGSARVGGLVGFNEVGTVEQCYATGLIGGNENVGGLVGVGSDWAEVLDSFWDVETSETDVSAGGMGRTTAQMQTPGTFRDAGWDFIGQADGPDDFWAEPEGGGYPILWWQLPVLPELPFAGGSGEPNDPYLIATAEQLNRIGRNPRLMTAHFRLLNDIDAEGMPFFTIGDYWYPFEGLFDGNNYTISHLTISGRADVGFVGVVMNGGTVRDVEIADVNVTGTWNYIGAVVGSCISGSVMNCHSTGAVRGERYVGGLVGYNYKSDILQCSSAATVTGISIIGGLVGMNINARLDQCFSTSIVTGELGTVGGLVGMNSGTVEIADCYASGVVTGGRDVGGLVGSGLLGRALKPSSNAIRRCYSAGRVSGSADVGGLVGFNQGVVESSFWDAQITVKTSNGGTPKTTAEMQTAATYLDAGWDFVGETANGIEDLWWIDEGRDYPRL